MPKPKTNRDYLPFEIPKDYDESARIDSVDYGTIAYIPNNDHFDKEEVNQWQRDEARKLAEWIVEACNAYAKQ